MTTYQKVLEQVLGGRADANIASTIYGELKKELKEAPVKLVSIEVWESPESGVEYGEV